MTPGRCLAVLWIFWAAAWLILARWSAKAVEKQPLKDRLAHSLPAAFGAYLLASAKPFGAAPAPIAPIPAWLAWTCVGATAIGIAWMVWARRHLGRLWSGIVTFKTGHRIVRSGPYAITRHPIYTGLLLALLATALARATWTGFAGFAIMLAGFRLKIRQEETLLTSHFGDAYRAYRAEVPALVPRIKIWI